MYSPIRNIDCTKPSAATCMNADISVKSFASMITRRPSCGSEERRPPPFANALLRKTSRWRASSMIWLSRKNDLVMLGVDRSKPLRRRVTGDELDLGEEGAELAHRARCRPAAAPGSRNVRGRGPLTSDRLFVEKPRVSDKHRLAGVAAGDSRSVRPGHGAADANGAVIRLLWDDAGLADLDLVEGEAALPGLGTDARMTFSSRLSQLRSIWGGGGFCS